MALPNQFQGSLCPSEKIQTKLSKQKHIFSYTDFLFHFQSGKILAPHTKLYVSLGLNKPAFSLMSKHAGANDDTYKIEIINCDLYARIVDVDASINKEIENVSYQGNSMLYPMRRMKMEQHRIPANMREQPSPGGNRIAMKNIHCVCSARCVQRKH